jgi:hypothetical protein
LSSRNGCQGQYTSDEELKNPPFEYSSIIKSIRIG